MQDQQVIDLFETKRDALVNEGKSRIEAGVAVARDEPALHRQYLKATNRAAGKKHAAELVD